MSELRDDVEDVVSGAVGKAASSTPHSAKGFVANASIANLYEIEAAEIALARSRSERVRSVAERMIEDHRKLGSKLRQVADESGLGDAMAAKLDQRRRGMLDNLHTAAAEEFDHRYLQQQEMAHREAISLFDGYSAGGDAPELAKSAREGAELLKQHLEAVRSARGH